MQVGVNYKIKCQIPGKSAYYQYSEEEKDFLKFTLYTSFHLNLH